MRIDYPKINFEVGIDFTVDKEIKQIIEGDAAAVSASTGTRAGASDQETNQNDRTENPPDFASKMFLASI
jgi:hypothetical protein